MWANRSYKIKIDTGIFFLLPKDTDDKTTKQNKENKEWILTRFPTSTIVHSDDLPLDSTTFLWQCLDNNKETLIILEEENVASRDRVNTLLTAVNEKIPITNVKRGRNPL